MGETLDVGTRELPLLGLAVSGNSLEAPVGWLPDDESTLFARDSFFEEFDGTSDRPWSLPSLIVDELAMALVA
jgi:hypothetical protein